MAQENITVTTVTGTLSGRSMLVVTFTERGIFYRFNVGPADGGVIKHQPKKRLRVTPDEAAKVAKALRASGYGAVADKVAAHNRT